MLTDRDTVRIGDEVQTLVPSGIEHPFPRGTVKDVDRFGVLAEMDDRPGELLRLAWLHHGTGWRLVRPAV